MCKNPTIAESEARARTHLSDVPPHYLISSVKGTRKEGQGPFLISSQKTRYKGKKTQFTLREDFFKRYNIERKVTDQYSYSQFTLKTEK